MKTQVNLSSRSRGRVWLVTLVGTLLTLLIAVWAAWQVSPFLPGEQGAMPFVLAIGLSLLLSAPIYYGFAEKLRQLAVAHHELALIASKDSLTTCLNRGAFITLVDAYLSQINAPHPIEGALFVLDVDHFKAINDRYGHSSGDEALKLIARTIQSAVRPNDLVGRVGGEEFAVFLPRVDAKDALSIAERIRHAVEETPFEPDGTRAELKVSIGGAVFSEPVSFQQLFEAADRLLYRAKSLGRNQVLLDTLAVPRA